MGVKKRLINCDFLNAGAFTKLSNKTKLLYIYMFASADDKGFVNNTDDIIEKLTSRDTQEGVVSLELLQNDYVSALVELLNAGYVYEFNDKHGNRVHLIRHWFYHNKIREGLYTTYYKYLQLVTLDNNQYVIRKVTNKDKLNENKINEIKLTNVKGDKLTEEEWNDLLDQLQELEGEENED